MSDVSPYVPDSFQLSKNLHTPLGQMGQITGMTKRQIAFVRNGFVVEFDFNQYERKSHKTNSIIY